MRKRIRKFIFVSKSVQAKVSCISESFQEVKSSGWKIRCLPESFQVDETGSVELRKVFVWEGCLRGEQEAVILVCQEVDSLETCKGNVHVVRTHVLRRHSLLKQSFIYELISYK